MADKRVTRIPVTASGRGRIGSIYGVATGMDSGIRGVATGGSNRDGCAESTGVATGPVYMPAVCTSSDANDVVEDHLKQADVEIARLERETGTPISEPGRSTLVIAFNENHEGVLACWEHVRERNAGRPVGLLLRLIADGEHRWRTLPKPSCGMCGREDSSLLDVTARLDQRGGSCGYMAVNEREHRYLSCAECARTYLTTEEF